MTDLEVSAWPVQTELVIGLVGAVGVDLGAVYDELASVLSVFKYESHELHLSEQLQELDWDVELVESPYDERSWSYMSAGNQLRERWGRDDAFALLAINGISLARQKSGHTDSPDLPLDRHAYVLRSLKRKEEAELLRAVYGSRFVLLSVYAPKETRIESLKAAISKSRVHPIENVPKFTAEQLVQRDESEAAEHGQGVRGIFHQGDFFVDATRSLPQQLKRVVELLFGHPTHTPTRDEAGMFHAVAASRRSAELGRQVGAAICTVDGSVVAVGSNEVPRSGGGLYWDGDPDDAREFTTGWDANDRRKAELSAEIAASLVDDGLVSADTTPEKLAAAIGSSRIDDLIEFVRAVHAEMAAITDAARRGIPVAKTVLYATTFPCHHCARHVVAAGIGRVVYIAPYAKSLAVELHGDAICVDPPPTNLTKGKITFEPFVGVGPRRFLDLFEMPVRKDKSTGQAVKFEPATAMPRLNEIETAEMVPEIQPYIRRERRVFEILGRAQDKGGPRFTVYAGRDDPAQGQIRPQR